MRLSPALSRPLERALKEKHCLIAAHRGSWGGPVLQNTLPAYALALRRGADILETDVCLSADGEMLCFHDGSEREVFGREFDIRTLPLSGVRALRPLNAYGQETGDIIPTLEETLRFALDREAFLNVDRAWDALDRVCSLLDRYPEARERCILKAPMRKARRALSFLDAHRVKYMFMPIVYTWAEVEEALEWTGVNTVGLEMISSGPEDPLFGAEAMARVHAAGLFVWVNTLRLGERKKDRLYGDLDDFGSLENPGAGWGSLMEMGADVLQTDFADLVRAERERRYGR